MLPESNIRALSKVLNGEYLRIMYVSIFMFMISKHFRLDLNRSDASLGLHHQSSQARGLVCIDPLSKRH